MDLWAQRVCKSSEAAEVAPQERVQCVKDTAQGLSHFSRCSGLVGGKLFNTRSRFIPSPFSPGKAALSGGRGSGHRECEVKGSVGQSWHSVASWVN